MTDLLCILHVVAAISRAFSVWVFALVPQAVAAIDANVDILVSLRRQLAIHLRDMKDRSWSDVHCALCAGSFGLRPAISGSVLYIFNMLDSTVDTPDALHGFSLLRLRRSCRRMCSLWCLNSSTAS